MTASPLLVHSADRVSFLVDGRQAAAGSHPQLAAEHADYRAVMNRGMEADDEH